MEKRIAKKDLAADFRIKEEKNYDFSRNGYLQWGKVHIGTVGIYL